VKTSMTVKTEMDIALEALEKIAQHEKECGERWAEAVVELRELRRVADSHAARWERLAWLVVTVVVTGAASVIVTQLG
tara:strand:+ start:129 stop:362 length:234 start_codon:yes stop_codon:yes gene_type:complete